MLAHINDTEKQSLNDEINVIAQTLGVMMVLLAWNL